MGQGTEGRNPNEDTRSKSDQHETECPKGLGQMGRVGIGNLTQVAGNPEGKQIRRWYPGGLPGGI